MIRMQITAASIRALEKETNNKVKDYQNNASKAVYVAGLFLQAESQKIVPVDTGFLRASAFTRVKRDSKGYLSEVGYRAAYAIYVHENLNAKHAAGTSAKFLEIPFNEKRDQIIAIISAVMKKG